MKIKKLNEYKTAPVGIDNLTNLFVNTILDVAKNSVAKRLQVGCIFVKNNNIVGIGYNHTPFDRDQSAQVQLDDGTLKSKPWINYTEQDKDGVIHAEIDALRRMKDCGISPQGCSVYVTHSSCSDCANELVNSKIKEVFYVYGFRDSTGIDILNKNGIPCKKIK